MIIKAGIPFVFSVRKEKTNVEHDNFSVSDIRSSQPLVNWERDHFMEEVDE